MDKREDKKFLLKKVRLIVVGERDEEFINAMEYLGFEKIDEAVDGNIALQHMQEYFYGFVACYLKMEGMDSVEFIKKLRTDSKSLCRFSPLLLVTDQASVTEKLVADARDAGMTELLVKPFDILPLREKILSIIENPRNFIISRNYVGPDRRRKKVKVDVERRKDK